MMLVEGSIKKIFKAFRGDFLIAATLSFGIGYLFILAKFSKFNHILPEEKWNLLFVTCVSISLFYLLYFYGRFHELVLELMPPCKDRSVVIDEFASEESVSLWNTIELFTPLLILRSAVLIVMNPSNYVDIKNLSIMANSLFYIFIFVSLASIVAWYKKREKKYLFFLLLFFMLAVDLFMTFPNDIMPE